MAADQKQNIELVKEIENYPYIYNYTLPEYARRDLTEKAWIEIGQKVNLSGPECKEKWKNFRSVFARRLKRRKAGKRTHKKPYYLAKYMQFTIPFLKMNSQLMKECPSYQRGEMSDSETDTINCNETDEDDEVYKPTKDINPISIQHPSQRSSETSSVDSSEVTVSLQEKVVKHKVSEISRTRENQNNNKNNHTLKKAEAYQFEQESNKMFLLSLLLEMDAMNDKQRRFFKHKILEVINDIFVVETPEI